MKSLYKVPAKLFGTSSTKTEKGQSKGYTTYILYLAPFNQNSLKKNVCAYASDGCAAACLFSSGRGKFSNVINGRVNKTEYFLADRVKFLNQAVKEIKQAVKRHEKDNSNFCVRFNGTSDLPIENLKIDGLSLLDIFPDVQFYDYSKNYTRFKNTLPANYHLTFSRSETNENKCIEILNKGYNVAMVFESLPKTYKGYKVINGDETDLRFLDEQNVIVGLTYKKTGKETDLIAFKSNFVISDKVLKVESKKVIKTNIIELV